MRFENPVLTKEMRILMRGRKSFIIPIIYLAILSLIFFIMYISMTGRRYYSYYQYQEMGRIGKDVFWTLAFVQLALVSLLSPAFSCGAIVGEKEQKTFDLLRATLLSPRTIVFGKLLSSLSFAFLLVISSIPVLSICFTFGGVSPREMVVVYLLILISAFSLGSLGLFSSSMGGRMSGSVAGAYLMTMAVHCPAAIAISVLYIQRHIFRYTSASDIYLKVFGFPFPIWSLAAIAYLWMSTFMLLRTVTNLRTVPSERPLIMRLLFLIFYLMVTFFLLGGLSSTRIPPNETFLIYLITCFCLLVFTAAIVSEPPKLTGKENMFRILGSRLFNPRNILSTGSLSGLSYILLLYLLGICFFHFCVLLGAKISLKTEDVLISYAVVLISILAFSMIGILISICFKRLASSRGLSFFLITSIMVWPFIAHFIMEEFHHARTYTFGPWVKLLYLNPVIAIGSITDSGVRADTGKVLGDGIPFWKATILFYCTVAVVIGVLDFFLLRRMWKRKQENEGN